jgi:hypothetical protein
MMNERRIKGNSILGRLAGVLAIVKYHAMFAGQDFRWFKDFLDNIPVEDPSELKRRKAAKYVSYEELEAIPEQIRKPGLISVQLTDRYLLNAYTQHICDRRPCR